MPDTKDYFLGVDLGGTKILAAAFTPSLKCLGRAKRRTRAERGPTEVTERIARTVQEALKESGLDPEKCAGVGVGAPGAVDSETGKVIFAPNLDWRGVPLKRDLERRLKLPVFVDNDCTVATLGVFQKELGGKPSSVVGMFIGTGIGGGIIIDGQPYAGASRTAAEIGHMVVRADGPRCGCGRKGCLEALASRTAMVKRIQAAVKDGEKSAISDIVGEDLSRLKSSHLRKAVEQGDRLIRKTLEDASRYLGIGVANLVNVLNPQYVVVGGGVIGALEDKMFSTIVDSAREYIFPGAEKGLQVMPSKLGDDAGITGAAALAQSRVQ